MTRKYLDLSIAMGITALTAVLVIAFPEWRSPVRIGLGLVVVLAAPGYVLMNALFPGRTDIDGVERLALTLGLSIASVPPIGLILDALPWGIRLAPIAVAMTVWVAVFALLAGWRRARMTTESAFEIPWGTSSFWQGAGLAAFVMAVLLGVPALAVALRPDDRYTEFYVLGATGQLQDYPRDLEPGEPFDLTFGIGNFEKRPLSYELRVPFDPQYVSYATPIIPEGERWEQTITLTTPAGSGRTQLDFELWRADSDADANEPYRTLKLFVTLPGPTVFPELEGVGLVPLTPLGSDGAGESPPGNDASIQPASQPSESAGSAGGSTPAPASAQPDTFLHAVTQGETLYGLARQYLNDGNRYLELFNLNRDVLEDPRTIPPGVQLRIPVTP